MEDCYYLEEKEPKQGIKEYFVYLNADDNVVTSTFEDREELRDHLANRGTSHGQPWSMGAVTLLKENKKIPREFGFIKPVNSNYRQEYQSWKTEAGECNLVFDSR